MTNPFLVLGKPLAPLAMAAAFAQFTIPGINLHQAAIGLAAKQLAPYVQAHAPILRDWNDVYAQVRSLPGGPFHPALGVAVRRRIEKAIVAQLHRNVNGVVNLAPGDYAIPIRLFCTDIGRHAQAPLYYVLGPLRGTRAGILTALYARDAGDVLPNFTVQTLSWSLQDGMKYDELPDLERHAFDRLLPGLKGQIRESFLEQVQSEWDKISGRIPGLPSFDDALGHLGGVGSTLNAMQQARDEIVSSADDFDALRARLAPLTQGVSANVKVPTPWSRLAPNVYARIRTGGAYLSVGVLEIRVTGAADPPVSVFADSLAYPPSCNGCQPMTWTPAAPGSNPNPALPSQPAPPGSSGASQPGSKTGTAPGAPGSSSSSGSTSPSGSTSSSGSTSKGTKPAPKPTASASPGLIQLGGKATPSPRQNDCLNSLVAATEPQWQKNAGLRDALWNIGGAIGDFNVASDEEAAYIFAAMVYHYNGFPKKTTMDWHKPMMWGMLNGGITGHKLTEYFAGPWDYQPEKHDWVGAWAVVDKSAASHKQTALRVASDAQRYLKAMRAHCEFLVVGR